MNSLILKLALVGLVIAAITAMGHTVSILMVHPYVGTGKIITFAFHFFHFKTFSGKVEK